MGAMTWKWLMKYISKNNINWCLYSFVNQFLTLSILILMNQIRFLETSHNVAQITKWNTIIHIIVYWTHKASYMNFYFNNSTQFSSIRFSHHENRGWKSNKKRKFTERNPLILIHSRVRSFVGYIKTELFVNPSKRTA